MSYHVPAMYQYSTMATSLTIVAGRIVNHTLNETEEFGISLITESGTMWTPKSWCEGLQKSGRHPSQANLEEWKREMAQAMHTVYAR